MSWDGDDLAGDHLGGGDRAVDRGAQDLGLDPGLAHDLASAAQALELGLGVGDLALAARCPDPRAGACA